MNIQAIVRPNAPRATVLVRLMVGCVFLSEGIQKFLFSQALGTGRFVKIGIPAPHLLAPFVGIIEIACGVLVILGLFTRLASIPLLSVISVAILTTKLPLLAKSGFWTTAHEARTDFCMLLGTIFLALVGSGPLSLDSKFDKRAPDTTPKT